MRQTSHYNLRDQPANCQGTVDCPTKRALVERLPQLIVMAWFVVILTITVGCVAMPSEAELDGRNVHPVTVENHSPYVVTIEGNYDWKPVKITPGKSWVINAEHKELIVTGDYENTGIMGHPLQRSIVFEGKTWSWAG